MKKSGTKAAASAAAPTHRHVAKKPTDSAPPIDVSNPRQAQAAQAAERDRLTARIAALKAQIAAGERSRSGASVALQRAERALAGVNRRLEDLARRQRDGEARVAGLDRQRAGTESQLASRQAASGQIAALFVANGERDPFHAFLDGGDPAEQTTTDIDLRAAATAEASGIDALHGRVRDLRSQRQRADDDNRALLAQAEAQKSARDALAADQTARQKTIAELSRQLVEQRSAAAALAADEQRLTRVVEQLQRVVDRQAAEERAKRDAARRAEARRRADEQPPRKNRGETAKPPPPAIVDEVPDAASGSGAFARLRGQLRLPVRGTLVGRFGAPRGTGGATWKGVFVRTEAGADVRAVAAGKVVFADDLRGFGNLVIVDHGDQYLSIYGNNETLLRHAGDAVKAGDVLARAGDSSGDGETGLYFELRFRGRPFDPLSWTGGR